MKKAEFLLEVKAELENIKAKATKEEIGNLTIQWFSHNSPTRCIYGQMTGNCTSERAIELTPKTYTTIGSGSKFSYQSYSKKGGQRFTALEKYLYMVDSAMHKSIIAYLKGDINGLVLE